MQIILPIDLETGIEFKFTHGECLKWYLFKKQETYCCGSFYSWRDLSLEERRNFIKNKLHEIKEFYETTELERYLDMIKNTREKYIQTQIEKARNERSIIDFSTLLPLSEKFYPIKYLSKFPNIDNMLEQIINKFGRKYDNAISNKIREELIISLENMKSTMEMYKRSLK
jgi:hypothetical protein